MQGLPMSLRKEQLPNDPRGCFYSTSCQLGIPFSSPPSESAAQKWGDGNPLCSHCHFCFTLHWWAVHWPLDKGPGLSPHSFLQSAPNIYRAPTKCQALFSLVFRWITDESSVISIQKLKKFSVLITTQKRKRKATLCLGFSVRIFIPATTRKPLFFKKRPPKDSALMLNSTSLHSR